MHQANPDRYREMSYARSGKSGLKLPRVSLGLWHNFGGTSPYETARDMILRSFDSGIIHFDLANNYGPPAGSAEETFGRVFKQDLTKYRNELVVSTKAGYWMWDGPYGEWGSRKYEQEGMGCIAFSPLAQGLLTSRYLSGTPADARVNLSTSFRQEHLNEDNLRRVRALHQIAERRGQSLAQMALAWVLRKPVVTSVLIGASRWSQVDDCLRCLGHLEFSQEELAEIDKYAHDGSLNIWSRSSKA